VYHIIFSLLLDACRVSGQAPSIRLHVLYNFITFYCQFLKFTKNTISDQDPVATILKIIKVEVKVLSNDKYP
jgi:hypothetical protein